jgi:hypothetical protein
MFAQLYRRVKMANLIPGVLAPETPPANPVLWKITVTAGTLRV